MNIRAIEGDFPFEFISEIAEAESWRKEVYRPIYHMHKWWARRLGSVFRAVILGAACTEDSDLMDLFYKPMVLKDMVVFDPFMGSGTTIGEAYKLGCSAIGRDINPVAYRLAKTALSKLSRPKLIELFSLLRDNVAENLLGYYQGLDSYGEKSDVLYYFWVKVLPCPACRHSIDLFSTYVFASHAYPKKYPQVHIICPDCNQIFESMYGAEAANCPQCGLVFNPHNGCAQRSKAECRHCGELFPIAKIALAQGHPPEHRMYAKLVLRPNGKKEYLPITQDDLNLYEAAQKQLEYLDPLLPHIKIEPGHNTQQVLNYGYNYWDEMFNKRQLLSLSILANGIKSLPSCSERDVLMLLFSGVLEFNNMFASYKGEGTGAVRHMFSHHILKPERMPIEANVWGTEKSSGSFATLFQSRILRAIDYKEAPFEISIEQVGKNKRSKKVFGLNPRIEANIIDAYPPDGLHPETVYLSCGSSSETDLPGGSVDIIVTDPPFFDNVHYAELADFFHVWQRLYFDDQVATNSHTTRHLDEVQDADVNAFAKKLSDVFFECHRVLRDDGLLIFSYHHSRQDGWLSVAEAVLGSGFSFVQAQPVKSEMSVATPKSQAKNPIDLDIFLVCRKRNNDKRPYTETQQAFMTACQIASSSVKRFNKKGRVLSINDVMIVLYSQYLVELSPGRACKEFLTDFENLTRNDFEVIKNIWDAQAETDIVSSQPTDLQLPLF
jgi:putative DNA methylase